MDDFIIFYALRGGSCIYQNYLRVLPNVWHVYFRKIIFYHFTCTRRLVLSKSDVLYFPALLLVLTNRNFNYRKDLYGRRTNLIFRANNYRRPVCWEGIGQLLFLYSMLNGLFNHFFCIIPRRYFLNWIIQKRWTIFIGCICLFICNKKVK
jgi:hypothetical protein